MRVAQLTIIALLPFALAAPILKPKLPRNAITDVLGKIGDSAAKLINPNATAAGIIGAVKQSVANPALTGARIEVVKSASDLTDSLKKVSAQAESTGNADVQDLATKAQAGVTTLNGAVGRIGSAVLAGTKPSTDDQKIVIQGVKTAQTAINSMNAAIKTPDATLSSNIATALTDVTNLKDGGESVLTASNSSLASIGLPSDFLG